MNSRQYLWSFANHSSHTDDGASIASSYLGEPTFLQLQYSQTAILIFNGVLWPHVTVATLTLSNG